MLMLDGSSLAGVLAPLPLWPRKPTPLDQLQPLAGRLKSGRHADQCPYAFAIWPTSLAQSISIAP